MFNDALTGETWRFVVIEHPGNGERTILRGRLYQLPSDWTCDSWRDYWDGDGMVAFIEDRGCTAVTENEETERAITAYRYSGPDALDRLAPRLIEPHNPESRFIHVGLDRGTDLYALSWDGDPEGEWRDEIDAVYHGDIWRIEVEEYQPGMGYVVPGSTADQSGDWVPSDDVCAEWYGEDKARAAFETREFPLAAFPAEMFVTAEG